jgi:hypothetical protein
MAADKLPAKFAGIISKSAEVAGVFVVVDGDL